MTELEQQILDLLRELENAAKKARTQESKPNFIALFAKLDDLTGQLPKTTAPDLLHYLHRKSYQKARLFLEGRDAENAEGSCRHP